MAVGEQFSYLEYQSFMLVLMFGIGAGLVCIEIAFRRFQVLPIIFPGMFVVQDRRLYLFDFEITDGAIAEKLRTQSKILIRMTLCLVMSYLWQRCVMETQQQIGRHFPKEQCGTGFDCFYSPLNIKTLFTREYIPVECEGPRLPFERTVIQSCIRFVQPSATEWLMHLAIAQSVTQLNIKSFAVCVQVVGNSYRMQLFMPILFGGSIIVLVVLFFLGIIDDFLSSWLSFVMAFSLPIFMWAVWETSKIYVELWERTALQAQQSIEKHLQRALQLHPGMAPLQDDLQGGGLTSRSSMRAKLDWCKHKAGLLLPIPKRDVRWDMFRTASAATKSGERLEGVAAPSAEPGGSESPAAAPGSPAAATTGTAAAAMLDRPIAV